MCRNNRDNKGSPRCFGPSVVHYVSRQSNEETQKFGFFPLSMALILTFTTKISANQPEKNDNCSWPIHIPKLAPDHKVLVQFLVIRPLPARPVTTRASSCFLSRAALAGCGTHPSQQKQWLNRDQQLLGNHQVNQ